MPAPVSPYGSWKSPITADLIVAGTVSFGQIALDGADVCWSESRPAERGRNAIVRRRAGLAEDVLAEPFNARTRAHEYGGGAFTLAGGVLWFTHDADQRVYRQPPGEAPRPITLPAAARYADFTFDRTRARLIGVCEDHSASDHDPVNSLVALDARGERPPRVLASGADFYSSPSLSPDGRSLVWLSWNHPDMPWDATELWLAAFAPDGSLLAPRRIAGGGNESIFQPQFAPDGTLYFVSDRSGWWNLHRWRDGRVEPVAPREAEFGLPQWVFGMSTYAFASERDLVCTFCDRGRWRLARVDLARGTFSEIEAPYSEISGLRAAAGQVYFIAGTPAAAPAIVRLALADRTFETLKQSSAVPVDAGYLSAPQAIEFSGPGGMAHAFFYPPRNRDFHAPPDDKPPLLVLSHGGPTSAAGSGLNFRIQFWTSRGFAVLDVNYRGSTGYGRVYRERLNGAWGVADVEDCVAGARHLVERGLVDGARLAIRGGSAGGYTTLCALTFHTLFRAGASHYGVSDLEALAHDTHKFEARYLDRLIGPYPQRRDLYVARSPIHHADRLSCPAIFFQGLEDRVVPPDQTGRMVAALRGKGVPVAYVPFEGEAHGFRRAENIKRALEAELYFYSRVFGFAPADAIEPVPIDNLG